MPTRSTASRTGTPTENATGETGEGFTSEGKLTFEATPVLFTSDPGGEWEFFYYNSPHEINTATTGAEVAIEREAGAAASIADFEFEQAGATIGDRVQVLGGANIILCINGPEPSSLSDAKSGALLVGATPRLVRR